MYRPGPRRPPQSAPAEKREPEAIPADIVLDFGDDKAETFVSRYWFNHGSLFMVQPDGLLIVVAISSCKNIQIMRRSQSAAQATFGPRPQAQAPTFSFNEIAAAVAEKRLPRETAPPPGQPMVPTGASVATVTKDFPTSVVTDSAGRQMLAGAAYINRDDLSI